MTKRTHIIGATHKPKAAPLGAMAIATVVLSMMMVLVGASVPASALEPIVITGHQKKINITLKGELYQGRGDRLQIETAAGKDGIADRMAISAATRGTNPNWVVFALNNPGEKAISRWLTVDRYSLSGSKFFWPELDNPRIIDVTPSLGFKPERVKNKKADIFRLTVEPGETVTFVAELSALRFPQIQLWRANPYINHRYDTTLFSGILLGITAILAIYLTTVFAANHQAIFPATAVLAWAILSYLCVDFGFWHKLFNLHIEDNAIYRAASEAAIAGGLILFLYAFLRLTLWHRWVKFVFLVWFLAQLTLIPLAILDSSLAAGLARLSYVLVAGAGGGLIAYLAINGQERALALGPTWLLFGVWMFSMFVTIEGHLSGEIIVSALNAGLVLVLALLTFTATQFAFRGSDSELTFGAPRSQLQLRALAIEGADSAVWEWQPRRDEISVSTEVEDALGLAWGTLSTRVKNWLRFLHPADRERFRLMLFGLEERNGGDIDMDFRMRRSDGSYLWFGLKAHSMDTGQTRALRCVGLMRDVTDSKRAQERLMHDAVHDSLTGLPNRELFLDRLSMSVTRVIEENATNPTLMFIDIDRFKNVNKAYGFVVGDSMLLTVARRLSRHLRPQDTLARIGGDQFAILLVTESNPQNIAMLAERIRRALRSPMKISGDEIILTSSIGISIYDGRQQGPADLFSESELAMYSAKRSGTDRIELFNQKMTEGRDDRVAIESDLRVALKRNQMKVNYQPIMRLGTNELAGFEALLRWDHPKFGAVHPAEFIPIAEESDLIGELGGFVLEQAVQTAKRWQSILPRTENPLFVSVNVSSRQIFRRELVQDIRHILGRQSIPPGTLRLEITESLVMENPEQAAEILEWLRSLGASLSLDDFGTGYSSLAYLHRLPFDTLKVDKELVQNRNMNASGMAILRSIVALAHELDKDVVAEGVEYAEDVTFLRSINCDFAQGFYFGEAIGASEVEGVLHALSEAGGSVTAKKLPARKNTDKAAKQPGSAAPQSTNPAPKKQSVSSAATQQNDTAPPRPKAVKSGLRIGPGQPAGKAAPVQNPTPAAPITSPSVAPQSLAKSSPPAAPVSQATAPPSPGSSRPAGSTMPGTPPKAPTGAPANFVRPPQSPAKAGEPNTPSVSAPPPAAPAAGAAPINGAAFALPSKNGSTHPAGQTKIPSAGPAAAPTTPPTTPPRSPARSPIPSAADIAEAAKKISLSDLAKKAPLTTPPPLNQNGPKKPS